MKKVLIAVILAAVAGMATGQEASEDPVEMLDRLDSSIQIISEGVTELDREIQTVKAGQRSQNEVLANHETRLQTLEATLPARVDELEQENRSLRIQMWIDRGVVSLIAAAVITTLVVLN
jgi:TolA-binding protein